MRSASENSSFCLWHQLNSSQEEFLFDGGYSRLLDKGHDRDPLEIEKIQFLIANLFPSNFQSLLTHQQDIKHSGYDSNCESLLYFNRLSLILNILIHQNYNFMTQLKERK
jgi:hypothetical protein